MTPTVGAFQSRSFARSMRQFARQKELHLPKEKEEKKEKKAAYLHEMP
jgi:hypothetical protein